MKITKTELKQMITEAVHQALKESSERDHIDADRDYKLKKRGLREDINKIPRPWNKYFEIAVDANEYNEYEDDKACNNGYDELEHITFVRLKPEYDYDDFAIGELTRDDEGTIYFAQCYGWPDVRCVTYTFDNIDEVLRNLHN